MLCATMAMAFVLDSLAPTEPANLVSQLGSSRYAVRVAAEGELARLGRGALPALRAARDSKDAEIRARSLALLSRIEDALILQATPISIDLRDAPLADAVGAIHRQVGPWISIAPEDRLPLEGRRVSLRSPGPIPFWKAIDALCSAGGLHVDGQPQPTRGLVEGPLTLADGIAVGPGLVSDAGPFRVQLSSVHALSEIQLGQHRQAAPSPGPPPPSSPSREFFLQLVVNAEPRLSITRNGAFKDLVAVDDRGQSLAIPAMPGGFQHTSGYFGMNPSSVLRLRVDLNYPDPSARQIRSLRGLIPVLVAMRKPDPLVLSLADSRSIGARNDEVAVTLLDQGPARKGQPATIQLSIKALGEPAQPVGPVAGEPLGYRPDSPRQQVEILDSQGKELSWFPSGTSYNGDETRLTLTVAASGDGGGAPATLRYHRMIRANADVSFEFRDIPIP